MSKESNKENLRSWWNGLKWILVGFVGLTSSAGCFNWASSAHAGEFTLFGIANLALYAVAIYRELKKK